MTCRWLYEWPNDLPEQCDRTVHDGVDENGYTFHGHANHRWSEAATGARKKGSRR